MSEKAIEANTCTWLAFQGYTPLKIGLEGWPDRLVLLGVGRHVWIEFKTPTGKLRAQQVNRIEKLKEIGEVVFIVTSLEDCQRKFEAAKFASPLSTYSRGKDSQKETARSLPETWAWQDSHNPNRPKGNK